MEVTDSYKSDALQLGNLLDSLGIEDLEAAAADSAYLSRVNCDRIEALGAKPFIKLKRNTRGLSRGSFALKRGFGYRLSSVRKDLQRKELMTKMIVYNLNIVGRKSI